MKNNYFHRFGGCLCYQLQKFIEKNKAVFADAHPAGFHSLLEQLNGQSVLFFL
jgi:hypothetical protein